MKEETVSRNSAFLTISYVWQKILSFAYFILVARFIGVEDLGKYSFAISFATLFAVLVDFGFNSAIIRESAKNKEKIQTYFSTVFSFKLVVSLLTYFLVVLLVNLLNYPEITKKLVYLAGIPMIFDQLANTFWAFFRGARNLKYESWNIVFNQIIILSIGCFVIFTGKSLLWLMAPFLSASFFSLIFSFWLLIKKFELNILPRFDKKIFFSLLAISIPFALIALFSRVYGYIDSIMLSKISGDSAVAYYNVAMKIPFALQFIPASLSAAVFPAFSFHYANNKEQLRITFEKISKFTALIAMPISFGVFFVAPKVIDVFYGIKYQPSVLPLQILMLGLYFVFINFIFGALLNATDRQVTNTKLIFSVMVINVVLNLIFIPIFGFVGSAVVFFCTHAVLAVLSFGVIRKIVNFSWKSFFIPLGKSFVGAIFMVFLLLLFKDLALWWQIILGAVFYVGLLFLLKTITVKELTDFRNSIFKKNIGQNNE